MNFSNPVLSRNVVPNVNANRKPAKKKIATAGKKQTKKVVQSVRLPDRNGGKIARKQKLDLKNKQTNKQSLLLQETIVPSQPAERKSDVSSHTQTIQDILDKYSTPVLPSPSVSLFQASTPSESNNSILDAVTHMARTAQTQLSVLHDRISSLEAWARTLHITHDNVVPDDDKSVKSELSVMDAVHDEADIIPSFHEDVVPMRNQFNDQPNIIDTASSVGDDELTSLF
jgi:hypothetical protein